MNLLRLIAHGRGDRAHPLLLRNRHRRLRSGPRRLTAKFALLLDTLPPGLRARGRRAGGRARRGSMVLDVGLPTALDVRLRLRMALDHRLRLEGAHGLVDRAVEGRTYDLPLAPVDRAHEVRREEHRRARVPRPPEHRPICGPPPGPVHDV